jgi:putative peptidoglycan lipid II flippase
VAAKGKSVGRNTALVALWTLVSRLLGAVRDLVVAHFFGASWIADAFYIAQTIPNAFRRLVGEGAVAAVLVPTYASRLEVDGERAARHYARALFGLWLAVVVVLVIAGILLAPLLVSVFAAGYADQPARFDLTVSLTRWMFPYLGLVSVVGFMGGIANSHGRFGAAAASPVLFNIFIIAGAVLPMAFVPEPIYGLAVGVVVGGLAQVALLSADLVAGKCAVTPVWEPRAPGLSEAWRLMLPQLFGIAIYQVNIIVLRTYASFLETGSVTQYYNASRLQELALGVFAVALATASQPRFARLHAMRDRRGTSELFTQSMRGILVINLGAAAGLMALAQPICIVLYRHGAFTLEATRLTADTLFWLGVALVPVGLVRMVGQVFYAFKQARKPVVAGFWAMLCNATFGALFCSMYGVKGLAMGLAVATTVQAALLLYWLLPQLEFWVRYSLLGAAARCLLAALAMGVPLYFASRWFLWDASSVKATVALFGFIGAGGFTYLVVCYAMRFDEVLDMAARITRKLRG